MTAAAVPSLARRVVRSSSITVLGFGSSQVIRLAFNLVLTRLLFPEAFGMMALVNVLVMGLAMLSDIGIGPAIMQSPRGDEPPFLDTAWTIQIVRGMILWVIALAATPALAWVYDVPELNAFLPVAAFALVISGFRPTRFDTANRHLQAGLVTSLELLSQVSGLIVAIVLAWLYQSIWALVVSGLMTSIMQVILHHRFLPGHRNRFQWERSSAAELLHFGKWIFLSTLCGFAIGQADKLILGRHLDLPHFGLYNIAFFLASVPIMLGNAVTGRVLIPVFRASPPSESADNAARVRKLRAGALGALLAMAALLAFGGAWLIRFLYDPRYHEAAGLVVLIAVMQAPSLIILTCDQAVLAMGNSRRFFVLTMARAVLVTVGLLLGLAAGGLAGAIVGQGLGNLAAYPVLAWLLRPYGAWDPSLDARFLGIAALLGALALWVNQESLFLIP